MPTTAPAGTASRKRSRFSLRIASMIRFQAVLSACLLLPLACPASPSPGGSPPVAFTQRGVNELAAALDNARHVLVDDTGLRRPGEMFPAYMERVADRLPGEETVPYRARIARYLSALEKATTETASARRLPILIDRSAANQLLWQRAVRALSYLPKRMEKTNAAWRKRLHEKEAGASPAFGTELKETMLLIVEAFDALRDARP